MEEEVPELLFYGCYSRGLEFWGSPPVCVVGPGLGFRLRGIGVMLLRISSSGRVSGSLVSWVNASWPAYTYAG